MIERIFCIVLLIISIGLLLELDRRNTELDTANKINSSLAAKVQARELELQVASSEVQCYHEECVRLAFEYMSDTVYILPCDGRQIQIGAYNEK